MTKFSNAMPRGTIPIYGTMHGDDEDSLRTFEYLKAVKPRKSKLDEVFEKSDGTDYERTRTEVGGS